MLRKWVRSDYRWLAILAAVVVGILILRLPSFSEPHWYDDEEIYLTIGSSLAQGGRLYADVIDHKPPFLYGWVALNPSLPWLKMSATLFAGMAALLIWQLGRLFKMGSGPLALAVGVFILMTNLPAFEGNIFNAELMFLPLSLAGVLVWWRYLLPKKANGRLWPAVVVGICFGLASLVKVPALTDLAALGVFSLVLMGPDQRRQWLGQMVLMGIGVAMPWLVTGLYFFLTGTLAEFLYYSIVYNFQYVSDWSLVVESPVLAFLGPIWIRLCLLAAGLAAIGLAWKKWRLPDPLALVLMWFWWSFFAALLSVRPYPHYYLQMAPALALGAGLIMSKLQWRQRLLAAGVLISLPIFILSAPITLYRTSGYYTNWLEYVGGQKTEAEYVSWFRGIALEHAQIGEHIRQRAEPEDRVFVWGNAAAIYNQALLQPATPYVTDFLIHSFDSYEAVYSRLSASPPRWLSVCNQDEQSFPKLFELLEIRYTKVEAKPHCSLYLQFPSRMLQ